MKSIIAWCFILAVLSSPILAEDEEEDDYEQNKRQTVLSTASTLPETLLDDAAAEVESAELVASPTATVSPLIHATSAPVVHTPPTPIIAASIPFPITRTFVNHGALVPVARPIALPLPAPAIPFTFPIHKPIFHVAQYPTAYPTLTHTFTPSAPILLSHGVDHGHYPVATASALKVVPAPNLAPTFAPIYRYGVAPFGFGYHPAFKYY